MDEQVSPPADEIVFVQVLESLLPRAGTQIEKFVPVQISAQLTQVFALEIDPAARASFRCSRYQGTSVHLVMIFSS